MSETIVEVSGSGPNCPLCESYHPNLTKLKTHLLLKHSEVNICLYCLEVRGESDTFKNPTDYNKHFSEVHSTKISGEREKKLENRTKIKRERKLIRVAHNKAVKEAVEKGDPPPPKLNIYRCGTPVCKECDVKLPDDFKMDRHLVTVHNYESCKKCHLLGPIHQIRIHSMERHFGESCFICCGTSQVFESTDELQNHVRVCHGFEYSDNSFPCVDCNLYFPSIDDYKRHAISLHGLPNRKISLRQMRRRRSKRTVDEITPSSLSSFTLKDVRGLKNVSGDDCFALAVLHLLNATDIRTFCIETLKNEWNCDDPRCILVNFFKFYSVGKRTYDPSLIVNNYSKYNIEDLPVDAPDFLRSLLHSVINSTNLNHPHPSAEIFEKLKSKFLLITHWKFECTKCQRLNVIKKSETCIKVSSGDSNKLLSMIYEYFNYKTCFCGIRNIAKPDYKNNDLKYLFIEIDRSVKSEGETKDLSLFSLGLENEYVIDGKHFGVFGVINYELTKGGGHYSTLIFLQGDSVVSIHEDEIKSTKKPPDFDVNTCLVGLVTLASKLESNQVKSEKLC